MSDEILSGEEIQVTGSTTSEEVVEYEEISSEEVDRVVAELEELMETVDSENIRVSLEEAINAIFYLVYDTADEEESDIEPLADAA
ncbi:MAG: hypothetical protein KDA79_02185 [Planctomycetaceae bacterium]|nr:hypothetical protein [Planctomycetaceae bacterium]